jgi:outer membrane lipoprotein-sorting protein
MFRPGSRAPRWGAFVLLTALTATPAAAQVATPAVAADAGADVAAIRREVYAMEQAYARVQDYTATFYKQERVKGRMLPVETIALKFRRPFSVYLRWTHAFEGREVLYVRGWNDDKIRAHQGSFPDITVNLRPDANLAMRGNRHAITELGFGEAIGKIVRGVRLAELRPQDGVQYVDHGEATVYGARSRCFEAIAPVKKFSPYYAHRSKICIDVKTKLPTRIMNWDDEDNLIEDYGFENVRLNVGLNDADFDPNHPDYNF